MAETLVASVGRPDKVRKASVVWGPSLVAHRTETGVAEIEVSAHLVHSKIFLRELNEVFPLRKMSSPIVISTMQHATMELIEMGFAVNGEKDVLLERFACFANAVCASLSEEGHWADFIDPCSGLPMIHQVGNIVYNEVQSAQMLLGYQVMNAGFCKILLHPKWHSAVYPASIVTDAPEDAVVRALEKHHYPPPPGSPLSIESSPEASRWNSANADWREDGCPSPVSVPSLQ